MNILEYFLQILFPDSCLGCGKLGVAICPGCVDSIHLYEQQSSKPLATYISPTFDYRQPIVRKLIWQLKYKGSKYIAQALSEKLYETLYSLTSELTQTNGVTKVLLIAIPIDSQKLRKRGFNQSEELIKKLLAHDTESIYTAVYGILCKNITKVSQAQTRSKTDRLHNIKNTMYLRDSSCILGQDIILVDDVVTTGATLSEARRVLLSAGARSVHAITIAH